MRVWQFAWGFMEILVYGAFHDTAPAAFPMEMGQLTSYIWLRQALLGLFMSWYYDRELLDMITSSSVAYEMCRPADIYTMWFTKNFATRCSRRPCAVFRFFWSPDFCLTGSDCTLPPALEPLRCFVFR